MQKKNAKHNVYLKLRSKFIILFFALHSVFHFGQTPCLDGLSAGFPCNNIDFLGQVSLSEFGVSSSSGNDCWGWTDPQTLKEWAIMGLDNGTGFVDISDPENPVVKMTLLSTGLSSSPWRDIKIYNNFAFIVSEAPNYGMQIFDLTHLREENPIPIEDTNFNGFGNAHNIAINEDTGYAYVIGANTYNGGPHFINIQDPLNPIDEGGFSGEGYTHDAHIISYNGPDTEHNGKEIYFGANENNIVIVDVTDKSNPITLANFVYSSTGYAHQLWVDENRQYVYIGDEQDELNTGINTRTIIYNISDLDNPTLKTEYFGPTHAIDHNNYTHNNKLYLANYSAGLRIIDIADVDNNNFNEIGYFDTYSQNNNAAYHGSWSVYPYFQSGNIIISDIEKGLFIVKENVINFPNDCVNNIIVCGNTDIELDVVGPGNILEINSSNACSGEETNSVWLKITIDDPGANNTLGFTLTPESTNIGEDYDFWIFGPNTTCDNLGDSIRCSTTNPMDSNQSNNLTGMNEAEVDESEGPGEDGNSFVHWLDNVQVGETYFLVIDRAVGSSAFSLEWNGTATFADPPTNELSPSFNLNQKECDNDSNGIEILNLTNFESLVVGNQDVTVAYYEELFLAEIASNEITTPNLYPSSVGITTVYMRLTDNITKCFSIFDMELTVENVPMNQPPNLIACDDDNDGYYIFDLTQQDIPISGVANNPLLRYYYESGGGETTITNPSAFENTLINQQTIFAELRDPSLFNCTGEISFNLLIFDTPTANTVLDWFVCDDDDENVGFFNFNLDTLNNQVLLDQDPNQFLISYHGSQQDADNNTNPYALIYTNQVQLTQETVYVRIENKDNSNCFDTTLFDINVFENPIFDLELTEYFCLNIPNYMLELVITTQGDYDYEWTDTNDFVLANTQNYTVDHPGNYIVTVTTKDGNNCSLERIVNVLPSEPAIITNIIINEYLTENNFLVQVEVTGLGTYEYTLDDEDGVYQDEPLFLNVSEGIHEIFVREIHDCGTVSSEIAVFSFPKFFTPNGDGDNEFWKTGLTFQPEAKITIFDRYGKVMTQITPSLNQSWDGLYNNSPAPETDYWFIAEVINDEGKTIYRKGHFSLIRI